MQIFVEMLFQINDILNSFHKAEFICLNVDRLRSCCKILINAELAKLSEVL